MIDEIVAEEFASPDLELHWLDEDEGDPETVLEGRLKVGALTLNEMRDTLGLDPFDNAAADRPMVLTATGYVPIEANAGGERSNTGRTGANGQSAGAKKQSAKLALLKASSDDPEHPGWPTGTPGGRGGKFRPKDSDSSDTAAENVQLVNDVPPGVGLIATIKRLVATGHYTEEEAAEFQQGANALKALDDARLMAAIEGITVRDAQSVLSAQEFAQLRAAYLAGEEATVSIGGRTIQYEPNIPPYISAMTNFKGNGFSIGPGAFATTQETQATVLQELFRLNTTEAGVAAVHSGESTAIETAAARAFAEKILQSGVMGK